MSTLITSYLSSKALKMEVIVDDCEDWLGFTISKVVRDTTHGQAYHVPTIWKITKFSPDKAVFKIYFPSFSFSVWKYFIFDRKYRRRDNYGILTINKTLIPSFFPSNSPLTPVQWGIFQLGEDIKLSNRDNVPENIKFESRKQNKIKYFQFFSFQ